VIGGLVIGGVVGFAILLGYSRIPDNGSLERFSSCIFDRNFSLLLANCRTLRRFLAPAPKGYGMHRKAIDCQVLVSIFSYLLECPSFVILTRPVRIKCALAGCLHLQALKRANTRDTRT